MKKLFSPTLVGILVGLVVTVAFVWCYVMITTYVGAGRPVRATAEDLPEKFQQYCNEAMTESGSFSLPEAPESDAPCRLLYGFVSENGQDYPFVGLVARQVFMEEYLIRKDLMGYSQAEDSSPDRVWIGSGDVTADRYIFLKYTAHYEIDENGATVTYERHVKVLDLVSVMLLFSLADVAGRGFCRMHLKKKAAGSAAK